MGNLESSDFSSEWTCISLFQVSRSHSLEIWVVSLVQKTYWCWEFNLLCSISNFVSTMSDLKYSSPSGCRWKTFNMWPERTTAFIFFLKLAMNGTNLFSFFSALKTQSSSHSVPLSLSLPTLPRAYQTPATHSLLTWCHPNTTPGKILTMLPTHTSRPEALCLPSAGDGMLIDQL